MKFSQANILKVSAVTIAAPRYVGAFAASIGMSALEIFPSLAYIEMFSGAAMALLEGFALAFILGKIRQLEPGTTQHKTLTRFAWMIAATLPIIGLPYLLSEQNQQTITELFAGNLLIFAFQIGWSLTVLIVPVLVVMAVGYADVDQIEQKILAAKDRAKVAKEEARVEQTVQKIGQAAKQTKLQIKQELEQAKQDVSKPFSCDYCTASFESIKGLNGHLAHCKSKQNGSKIVVVEEVEE